MSFGTNSQDLIKNKNMKTEKKNKKINGILGIIKNPISKQTVKLMPFRNLYSNTYHLSTHIYTQLHTQGQGEIIQKKKDIQQNLMNQ